MRIRTWFLEKNFADSERGFIEAALATNSFFIDNETEKALHIQFYNNSNSTIARWVPKSCVTMEDAVIPNKKKKPQRAYMKFADQYVIGQNSIVVRKLSVNADFHFLWLKSVVGVDLNTHCCNCLIGKRETWIAGTSPQYKNPPTSEVYDKPLDAKIYYLCGVSEGYIWKNNFHLAFMENEGETLEYENNGIYTLIENTRQLPISPEYIDPRDPHIGDKQYSTCRNWQFAHYAAKYFADAAQQNKGQ